MSITHKEFQFNAKVLGFNIATDNIYNAEVLQMYLLKYFNDSLYHPVPNYMYIKGSIAFPQYCISLPKNAIIVIGDLSMCKSIVNVLPDYIEVHGNLALNKCHNLHVLPDDLTVHGWMDINHSNIKSIPNKAKCNNIIGLCHIT